MVVRMPNAKRISDAAVFYDYGAMPDSQTVLAHAYRDALGALLDFKSETLRAETADDALNIALLLAELRAKAAEMEDLALKTADLINGGNAA